MSDDNKTVQASGAAPTESNGSNQGKKDTAKFLIERVPGAPVSTAVAYVPYVTHETSERYEHHQFDESKSDFEVTEDVAVRAVSCFNCERLPGQHTGGKCAGGAAPDFRFRVKKESKVRIKLEELPKE